MEEVQDNYYSRQLLLEGWNQSAISDLRVLVVGLGAIGNETVKNLCMLGVKRISGLDFDVVEASNLSRCLMFNKTHVENKVFKADAVQEFVKNRFPHVEFTSFNCKVEDFDFEKNYFDVILCCLDNLSSRLHVNANAYSKSVIIDSGIFGFNGKIQVVGLTGPCIECVTTDSDYEKMWEKFSCSGETLQIIEEKVPSLITLASIVSGLQVQAMINYSILKNKDSYAVFYNGMQNSFMKLQTTLKKGCPVHVEEKPLDSC
ncbi:ThiF family protein [uncultured archaeon]|nr:ThiF family protein [uncultured archaeon]